MNPSNVPTQQSGLVWGMESGRNLQPFLMAMTGFRVVQHEESSIFWDKAPSSLFVVDEQAKRNKKKHYSRW
jgi:hypothetical protein